ncbi:hypothetical protein TNCV_4398141 [Trichonephila clavipes]|nr:hypothetical protein TNCV_4398141 [Trichonephila clavipes]
MTSLNTGRNAQTETSHFILEQIPGNISPHTYSARVIDYDQNSTTIAISFLHVSTWIQRPLMERRNITRGSSDRVNNFLEYAE